MSLACAEGDDVAPEVTPADNPIPVFVYGGSLACIFEGVQMSAFGQNALQTLAKKLLALGHDGDQQFHVHRGGEVVSRITLRDASQENFEP